MKDPVIEVVTILRSPGDVNDERDGPLEEVTKFREKFTQEYPLRKRGVE